ncbi:alpha-glucan family phosphorylase [Propylenella binzhouense]|uniref:Alpha-glucan family phosphorylase n=1 Tax=Propylenella binzhouense TaxID=2555902 RepID=A0A964T6D0_9HYPH|nr:alpha-glucan family phosphorylase [Propylenella binzhouense]MYZ49239.1 alpha-glucan family phosphorylase [Propylenella binzhouense]
MSKIDSFLARRRIAYFSMEIALSPAIHTYSGGLGVLAGDVARSCADLDLPVVFVTLLSESGYLRQEIDAAGRQVEHADPWNPAQHAVPLEAMVAVEIEGRRVWIRPWLYVLTCPLGNTVPVILLDTDIQQNAESDRLLTDRLYGGDLAYRIKQEIVLGIGGERILRALGFTIFKYHLNEGHAAFLALSLLKSYRRRTNTWGGSLLYEVDPVRDLCIFTTHTPVEAGHDRFPYDLVQGTLGDFIELEQLKLLAGEQELNMTRLALNLSGFVNGVARRHSETAQRMFPGYTIRAITNGVHAPTWTHPKFAEKFEAAAPGWSHEPEILARIDELPDEPIWAAHAAAKHELVAKVAELTGAAMDPERPILAFARRMTGYKRPDLLFTDLGELTRIAAERPFQIVMAGKAHPNDAEGKRLIEVVHRHIGALEGKVAVAFLPNYDFALARYLVAGADIWLNTPMPPLEASGTSGMKAAINGVLNFSVLDGWWVEACTEGVTGWAIGKDHETGSDSAAELYEKLGNTVLPLWYDDRPRWIWMMKQSISKIGSYFNTQRMMRRYATEAYLG